MKIIFKKLLSLIVIVLIVILVIFVVARKTDRETQSAVGISEVLEFVDTTLPESTRGVHFIYDPSLDTVAYLKFTTDEQAAKDFAESLGFSYPLSPKFKQKISDANTDWWDVYEYQDVVEDERQSTGKNYELAIRDRVNGEKVLYLVVTTTP